MKANNVAKIALVAVGVGFVGLAYWRARQTVVGAQAGLKAVGESIAYYAANPDQALRDAREAYGTPFYDLEEMTMGTRGGVPLTVRLNNPGAIRFSEGNRWQGSPNTPHEGGIGSFEQFENALYGARAMMLLLRKYVRDYGARTVPEILARWAPPTGELPDGQTYTNSTERYAQFVMKNSGVPITYIIEPNDSWALTRIARAMAYYEAGGENRVPEAWRGQAFWDHAWHLGE